MNLNYLKKSEELRRYWDENVLHLLSLDFLHVANRKVWCFRWRFGWLFISKDLWGKKNDEGQ